MPLCSLVESFLRVYAASFIIADILIVIDCIIIAKMMKSLHTYLSIIKPPRGTPEHIIYIRTHSSPEPTENTDSITHY